MGGVKKGKRGPDWSEAEVKATVASYFQMLELGLRGQAFSKTEHRKALLPLLNGRSNRAVELKHENISAILIEEKLPYISGYKPLGNYQELLRNAVLHRLGERTETRDLIEAEVQRVPDPPSIVDFMTVLAPPPKPRAGMQPQESRGVVVRRSPIDYLLMEARNMALGRVGERFIVALEQARLEAAGKSGLAASVSHVSVDQGDGLGYDILSYEEDTRERLIEVKTTKFGEYTPFYVTRPELEVSRQAAAQYHLYRLYSFGPSPRLFTRQGSLDETFSLEPSAYLARVG
jgi:hypothetical protein